MPAGDHIQGRFFEAAGVEASERRRIPQKIIFAFELPDIALHNQFRVVERRGAQYVLRLDETLEFDVTAERDDGLGSDGQAQAAKHGQMPRVVSHSVS